MMAETLVRALTPLELAERLRDSEDFATRTLAGHLINGKVDEYEEQIADLDRRLERSEDRAGELEAQREELLELLGDCLEAVTDADLKAQISKALA